MNESQSKFRSKPEDIEHYVTLFDQFFLPQGLALIESLKKWAENFQLWVIAMDSETVRILNSLTEPRIRIISVEEVENDELRKVKLSRTRGEYCWTLTPFTHTAVFERDELVERVTYIDADVALQSSTRPIFDEFERSGAAVLITEHSYAPEFDMTAISGKYCVQFMTFNRGVSDQISKWWQERCIEWCFARLEDGKFGDQKYLDDWTERFSELVHVLQHPGWALGPWNSYRYPYSDAIFYHFHGVRTVRGPGIQVFGRVPPSPTWDYFYLPYIETLLNCITTLDEFGWSFTAQNSKRTIVRVLLSAARAEFKLISKSFIYKR